MKAKKTEISAVEAHQSLIDIAQEAMNLARVIVENRGELTPDLEARLDFNEIALADKVDSYVHIEERLEAEAAFWKAKAEVYSKISKGFAKYQDSLRERVKATMGQMGVVDLKGNEYRYKLSKTKGKLLIEDEKKIPDDFKIQVITTAVDKERVRKMLEDGFEIPGAKLEDSVSLRTYENKE